MVSLVKARHAARLPPPSSHWAKLRGSLQGLPRILERPIQDYHGVMNDEILMGWLEHRFSRSPVYQRSFGPGRFIWYFTTRPSYRGFDPEIRVPMSNSEPHNMELLQRYGAKHVDVPREMVDDRSNKNQGHPSTFHT